jgi:hypothetical protein
MNAYASLAEEQCPEKQCLATSFTFDADTAPSIHIAQMMGVDYIFLQSANGPLSEKVIAQYAAQALELLALNPDNTLLICVELDNLGNTLFKRCDLHWLDNYPVHVHSRAISAANQQEFYSTILEHSYSL